MNFDYKSYIDLLYQLKKRGYEFCDYHDFDRYDRCVILRHDIDTSLSEAVQMAELEAGQNVKSTYFVLLTSDFYNVASAASRTALHRIQKLGHEIGLHFDEAAYGGISQEQCVGRILAEKRILSEILGVDVTTVSMHRPSKATLEGNLQIPGMINSYSEEFFHGFKYLSDSRRRWREPVEAIVESGQYDRLHILTHAFWYHDAEVDFHDTIASFINRANGERYSQLKENITDLHSVMGEDEVSK